MKLSYLSKELSASYNSIFIQLLALSLPPKNMHKPLSILKLKKFLLGAISYSSEWFTSLLFLVDFLRSPYVLTSHFLFNCNISLIIIANIHWVNDVCQALCSLYVLSNLNLPSIQRSRYHQQLCLYRWEDRGLEGVCCLLRQWVGGNRATLVSSWRCCLYHCCNAQCVLSLTTSCNQS